ncbi:MAG: IS1634 family transposase [Alphaproteobacteria bacterium]|nr:IS1634 family transposase [Alphaproteobacteria bacterium]
MFLRTTRSKLKDGTHAEYFQLAESVWSPEKKRPVTQIVHNFGRVDEDTRERLRRLAKSILSKVGSVEELATTPGLRLVDSYVYGAFHVVRELWRRSGLEGAVTEAVARSGTTMPMADALFLMVANRLLAPRSKLYCYEQWIREEVWYPGASKLELHHLYLAMDLLEEEHEAIEEKVFWHLSDLLNLDVDLIFYDTTSVHFEVDEEDDGDAPLRKRGHSKNKRTDLPQIVVGLAVTRDGFPVRSWLFPGNTVDVRTVARVKADLRGWRLGRCVFVGDAGMSSAENRRELSLGGGRWILAAPVNSKDKVVQEVLRRPGRYKELGPNLRIKEVWYPDADAGERRQRYVICHNPAEAERQRKHRDEVVRMLEAELATLRDDGEGHSKRVCDLKTSRRYGRYLRETKSGKLRIDRTAIREAAHTDGKWAVTSNDDTLTAEDLALGYKQLQRVEQAWRDMKGGLALRPVHHRIRRRNQAHIRLCVMALLIERMAEHACGDTWRNIRDDLNGIKVGVLSGPDGEVVQATTPKPAAQERLKKLGIEPPKAVLEFAGRGAKT